MRSSTVGKAITEALKLYPGSLCLFLVVLVLSSLVFALCCFHTKIASLNLTTQEQLNDKFGDRIPYSKGICKNLKDLCCRAQGDAHFEVALYEKVSAPENWGKVQEKLTG